MIIEDATTMKQVKDYTIYKQSIFEDAIKGLYSQFDQCLNRVTDLLSKSSAPNARMHYDKTRTLFDFVNSSQDEIDEEEFTVQVDKFCSGLFEVEDDDAEHLGREQMMKEREDAINAFKHLVLHLAGLTQEQYLEEKDFQKISELRKF